MRDPRLVAAENPVLEALPNAVVAVDAHGAIVYVNPQVRATFGYESDELIGRPVEVLLPERDTARHVAHRDGYSTHPVARPIGIGLDLIGRRKDGSEFPVEIGLAPVQTSDGLQVFATIIDITARATADRARAAVDRARAAQDRSDAAREHARLEAELDSAHLDDLTGAYRREVGTLALSHEIDRARRGDGRFVIAFVDVDGMKAVNDRDGHAAGDRVLRTLVSTMRSNLRSFDPIVRYGGDEFVCGIGGVDLDEAERRFDLIGRAVLNAVGVGITVGLATHTADETLDQLTARADAALLDARRKRHEQHVRFPRARHASPKE